MRNYIKNAKKSDLRARAAKARDRDREDKVEVISPVIRVVDTDLLIRTKAAISAEEEINKPTLTYFCF